MKFIKVSLLLFVAFLLAACAEFGLGHKDRRYAKHATVIPKMKIPPATGVPKIESYYPIPKIALNSQEKKPSILPPGSKILQYRHQLIHHHDPLGLEKPAAKSNKVDNQSLFAPRALQIPANKKLAWNVVGKALHHTHYQVLDEDQDLGTYYVLDSDKTAGKVTSITPIYRVNVKSMGKGSVVTVFDRNNMPLDPAAAKQVLAALQHAIKTG
ncbi:MAG: outer membrane protein assembly factor BamC [Gammaproteobacteria bacterium]|nr:outer membrane protein assembly factor BamC [Gammaproteobacteria bacterium]